MRTKKPSKEIVALASQLVTYDRSHVFTSSLILAEKFGKQHKSVLRAIQNLECSKGFTGRNFALSEYTDPSGRKLPFYEITRDGFMFLAMGFTGKTAAEWKEKFIAAFNFYEAQYLRLLKTVGSPEWQAARAETKEVRRELTDVLKEFVGYATLQGSKGASHYYGNVTKMVYKGLFSFEEVIGIPKRDRLNVKQLRHLGTAEDIILRAFVEGMKDELPYKEIYVMAKERISYFAGAVGQSQVIEPSSRLAFE